jgi:flagellum-specific ATP synthase
MPLGEMTGIRPGSEVVSMGHARRIAVGPQLLGRVLDGLGYPLDGLGPVQTSDTRYYPVHNTPPNALERARIRTPIELGVRAIDIPLAIGVGQRIGIFSGSGVGKSRLLGKIASQSHADVNVICLTGERGREVREFVEEDLGKEGLQRSVVVVATADQSPLVRWQSALVAMTIAEYFRNHSQKVLYLMDSLTRWAQAQREIGLAVGEPPATRGYTPSVFAKLAALLERAGPGKVGSITGIFTVLLENDEVNDPVSDTVRATVDGHIMLSRRLAARGHFPAIDVVHSVSRVMPFVTSEEHQNLALRLKEMLAVYGESEDLINAGAYVAGTNRKIDAAIAHNDTLMQFLEQGTTERSDVHRDLSKLQAILQ